jgi:hypothetical protein
MPNTRHVGLVMLMTALAVGIAARPPRAAACVSAADCDDGNPCTDELCDDALGCVYADVNRACDDGNACSTSDACNAGTCVGGPIAAGCTSCQAAAVLPSEGGTFTGMTAGTGSLTGSCGSTAPSPERAYRWTPAASGTAVIATCGTSTRYDSVVYVRAGTCGGAELGCNDDTTGCVTGEPNDHHGSRVTLAVTAGQTYVIVVDGYNGARGAYTLTVSPPSLCGNGVREGGEACDGGDVAACPSGQCTGSCACAAPSGGLPDLVPQIVDVRTDFGTTVDPGDVAEGCAEATTGVDLLRFGAYSRNDGTAAFVLGDPQCPTPCTDHPLEVCGDPDFVCSPAAGHNHAHYDNYARYDLLDGGGQTIVVGHKQGYCLRDTTCGNPVYTCANQGISAGCSDLYGSNLGCQYLDVTGIPSGTYTLRVTLDPFDRIAELSEGNNVAQQSVTIVRPGGSTPTRTATPVRTPTPTRTATRTPTPTRTATPAAVASATGTAVPTITSATPIAVATATATPGGTPTPITGCAVTAVLPAGGGSVSGTTAGASRTSGTCAATANAPEAVYQWTPSASGTAIAFTCGTETRFDSVLYVRSDTCSGGQIACNDDTTNCTTGEPSTYHGSRVSFAVTAGRTYFLVVDGYNVAAGAYVLTVTAPGGPVPSSTRTATPTTAATPSRTATAVATPSATRTATPALTATLARTSTPGTTTTPDATSTAIPTTTTAARTTTPTHAPTRTPTPAPTATPPTGGACGAAIPIPSAGGVFNGSTNGASSLTATCAATNTAPERVYQWTPSRSGGAVLETCGPATTFDTVLSIRQTSCDGGAERGCVDDTTNCVTSEPSNHHGSRVSVQVTAGQTYFIVVDGYGGARGDYTLRVTPP